MVTRGQHLAAPLIVLKIMLCIKVSKLIDNNKNNIYNGSIKNNERQNKYFYWR